MKQAGIIKPWGWLIILFKHVFAVQSFREHSCLRMRLCHCFAAMLFRTLSIHIVDDIVFSAPFFWIMPPLFFSIAMVALDKHEAIIIKPRDILLVFCTYLYPLCLVISLCFLFIAPFTSQKFSLLWREIVLICCVNWVLLNGVFQAGLRQPPYKKTVNRIALFNA